LATVQLPYGYSPIRTIGVLDNTRMATFKEPDVFKPVSTPNFSNFLTQLRSQGKVVRVNESLSALLASDVDTILIVNPVVTPSQDLVSSTEAWVRNGGRLIVLTDHTDIGGVRKPAQAILRPCGIDVNDDSVLPDVSPWSWVNNGKQSTLFPNPQAADVDFMGMSVGCSLKIEAETSAVILRSAQGFADGADPANGISRLGDMARTIDEHYGGNVVAALRPCGKGVYFALGDTSPFQDSTSWKYSSKWVKIFERYPTEQQLIQRRWASIITVCALLAGMFLLNNALASLCICVALSLTAFQITSNFPRAQELESRSLVVANYTPTPRKLRDQASTLDGVMILARSKHRVSQSLLSRSRQR
jgi:hypothetical protein